MRPNSLGSVVLLAFATATIARAEGVADSKRASTNKRIYGAGFLRRVGDGIASVGGSTLRYLRTGSSTWTTLHRQPGNLSRLGFDPVAGRLLAAWEKDTAIHAFDLAKRLHTTFGLPTATPWPQGASFFYVDSLALDGNGQDALLYMQGPVGNNAQRIASQVFRAKLDGSAEPELLFEVPSGRLLYTSERGALYDMAEGKRLCMGCLESALYAFDFTERGVERWRLLGPPQMVYRSVSVVGGSAPDRMVMLMLTGRGENAILRYRWGEPDPVVQMLPPGAGPSRAVVAPSADEIVYYVDADIEHEIVRRQLPPGSASTSTRLWLPWRMAGTGRLQSVYGMGVRPNGTIWIHYGDEMALIDAQGSVRMTSVAKLVPDKAPVEWAGSNLYIEKPEGLWIGIEVGASRDFQWVSFADLEKQSKPWPVRDPNVPIPRAPPQEKFNKCLPPDALIATPEGDIPVAALDQGMPVWTQDRRGDRVSRTVVATRRVPIDRAHSLVRLRLADGRTLAASPAHPLSDGRRLDSLRLGDAVDGSTVAQLRLAPYDGDATYDVLPSGPTGAYWVNGVLVGSTLADRLPASPVQPPAAIPKHGHP